MLPCGFSSSQLEARSHCPQPLEAPRILTSPSSECLRNLPVVVSVAASGAGSFTAQQAQLTRHHLAWHLQAD